MFKRILDPDIYHGYKKRNNFFEGWYFKLTTRDNKKSFGFIPGIIKCKDNTNSHSFIQFLDGNKAKFEYIRYNEEDFYAEKNKFKVTIEDNKFSLEGMSISIKKQGLTIQGCLRFNNVIKWPDSMVNPGSMGFYNCLSFMQCYSQVCAIDMSIQGEININGERIDFTEGKAYVEKNWGRDFPYSYLWVQCNCFQGGEGALSCSIGHIPMPKPLRSFTGFLIGFWYKDVFYKFSTINISKITIDSNSKDINIKVNNGKYILEFKTATDKYTYMDLLAPRENRMIPIASETIVGRCDVMLKEIKSQKIIFKDSSCCAGVEFSGNYEELNC